MLITGGTSGLGLGFAKAFTAAGNTVIICGRRQERLDEIQARNPAIITRVCDVADPAQREALFAWVAGEHPNVNVLINNAGVQNPTDLTKPVDLERVRLETETNFIAPVHLTSLFAQHLAAKPQAAIINISSGLGFAPLALTSVYCATKAAVHSLTLSLRYQLRNTSVEVIEIIPPAVATELGSQDGGPKAVPGAMSVDAFITEAMDGLKANELEIAVGQAAYLRADPAQAFGMMNR